MPREMSSLLWGTIKGLNDKNQNIIKGDMWVGDDRGSGEKGGQGFIKCFIKAMDAIVI